MDVKCQKYTPAISGKKCGLSCIKEILTAINQHLNNSGAPVQRDNLLALLTNISRKFSSASDASTFNFCSCGMTDCHDIADFVCGLISHSDKLVTYSATQCLLKIIYHSPQLFSVSWFDAILLQTSLTEVTTSLCTQSVFDLIRQICKRNLDCQDNCITALIKSWPRFIEEFSLQLTRPGERLYYDILFAFLRLWQCLIGQKDGPWIETDVIVNNLMKPGRLTNEAFVYNKALDVLLASVSSEKMIRESSQGLLSHTAKLLTFVPQVKGQVGFGGVYDEIKIHEDGKSATGDELRKHLEISKRKVVLLLVKMASQLTRQHQDSDFTVAFDSVCLLDTLLGQEQLWPFVLFHDQDDSLVDVLNSLLCLTRKLHASQLLGVFNAHEVFWRFLTLVQFDHVTLLDLLTSPETVFLAYLTSYLHLVIDDWQGFACSHSRCREMGGTVVNQFDGKSNSEEMNLKTLTPGEDNKLSRNQNSNVNLEIGTGDYVRAQIELMNHPHSNDSIVDSNVYVDCATDIENKSGTDNLTGMVDRTCVTSNVIVASSLDPGELTFQETGLDKVMTVLIQLRLKIERLTKKGLFPYNCAPLQKLLMTAESLYEGIQ